MADLETPSLERCLRSWLPTGVRGASRTAASTWRIVATAVIAGLAVATTGCGGAGEAHHEGQRVRLAGQIDAFDRPDALRLNGQGSFAWEVAAGTFGVVGSQAFAAPSATRSIATVGLTGGDGDASVRVVDTQSNAGLVFRYRDPANYWAVVVVPAYASWAIVRTVDGRSVGVANTGFSTTAGGTVVGVRMRGKVFDVTLDARVVRTVTDPALEGAKGVGITAMGPGPDVARFDDFMATVR